jgi:hypothetical protein
VGRVAHCTQSSHGLSIENNPRSSSIWPLEKPKSVPRGRRNPISIPSPAETSS